MANLQNWIDQAKTHWKEFQPTRYAALKEAGTLATELQQAAEKTSKAMSDLQASGFTHQEAWEQTRERWLFPPEQGSAPMNDSPEWSTSEPTTTADMMKAVSSGARTLPASKND